MDTINKSISKKIDFLRTLMIVFVLFIHNTNTIANNYSDFVFIF